MSSKRGKPGTGAGSGEPRAVDRLLVTVARQGGWWLAVLMATSLVTAATETALPAVLGRAVDAAVGHASTAWFTVAGVVVAILVVSDTLDDVAAGESISRSTRWLRHTVVGRFVGAGTRAGGIGPGELSTRLVGNAAEAGAVAPDMVRAVANLVPALGGTVALALIDPWLCLVLAVGLPILLVVLRTFARDASDMAAGYLDVQGRIAGRLVDALSGARTIAAAATAETEAQRILAPLPELHRYGMGMWAAQVRIAAQDALIVPVMELAVLAAAGSELARGRITAGEMLAAAQYVVLAANFGSAVTSVTRLARARAGAARTAEVMAEAPIRYGEAALPPGPGRVELRGVTVGHGRRPAIDRLDLVIPAGSLVALVGSSGAGKSVLAALLGRLVDPDEGAVLLDGIDLRRLGRLELRRAMAYGFERPALIGDTIADVIGFGDPPAGPQAVMAAARSAQADGFIRAMPHGYDTRLADAPMSGGEVQRIGLARAFAHGGRVLVLDDVAASLDTVTEHQISRVLTEELRTRTRVVVAHRASTAGHADLVAWIDAGRVRAIGTHAELWRDPAYRSLWQPGGAAALPHRPHHRRRLVDWLTRRPEPESRPAAVETSVTGGVG